LGICFTGLFAAGTASAAIPLTPDGQLGSPRQTTGTPSDVADVQIAGGGRFVVFDSTATDLMPGQPSPPPGTTCTSEVFRRDLLTNTTIVVSRLPAGGVLGNGCSSHPVISYDGSVVAFLTQAKNLGSDGTHAEAVVRNLSTDTLTTASVADGSGGAPSSSSVGAVALSGDGTKVAFTSSANLHSGVSTGGVSQVWLRDLSASTTTLVSAVNGSATSPAGAAAGSPSVDEWGLHVAFTAASSLTATATGNVSQVYVRTLASNATALASIGSGGVVANAAADSPSLAAIGSAVAFRTAATNLGDSSGRADDYVRMLSSGTTRLASTAADGTTIANASSGPPSLSAHGNIVAFASAATNLGAAPNGHPQVWVHDFLRNLVTLASPATVGGGANAGASAPSLAEGGIAVAYQTQSTNLDPGKTTSTVDAYVRRIRVSVPPAANTTSFLARDGLDGRTLDEQFAPGGAIEGVADVAESVNGRYAAFLVPLDSDLTGDPGLSSEGAVYVRDLYTGEVEAVNRQSDTGTAVGAPIPAGQTGGTGTDFVGTSGDGTEVTFESDDHVYVRNRTTGVTTQEDVTSGPGSVSANAPSFNANLSSDGRYLVFTSQASNLTPNHPAVGQVPYDDVYERDLQTGTTTIVSLPDGIAPGPSNHTFAPNGISGFDSHTSVADGGRYVVFHSRDAELGQSPPNQTGQSGVAYLRDMQTNHTVALQGPLTPSNNYYNHDGAVISADGSTVAFDSVSPLVPGVPFGEQVYYRAVHFNTAGAFDSTIHLASVPNGAEPTSGGTFGNGDANDPALSATGRLIAFDSSATNYGTANPGGGTQVWQRDTLTATTTLLSRVSGASGTAGNGSTVVPPASSSDGTGVVFSNSSANLAPDGSTHSFVYLRALPAPIQPPAAGTVTIAPQPPVVGVKESCAVAGWSGNPTLTYTWVLDSTTTVGSGATYIPVASDEGHLLSCSVVGTNPAGHANGSSAAAKVSVDHTLSVTVAGSGTVSGDTGPAIACPTTCSQRYLEGTAITLSAVPAPGFEFSGWTGGGCPASGDTCTITLSADTTVKATFSAATHPAGTHVLTVSVTGAGSGHVSGDATPAISCAPTCVESYAAGTVVTLTATASSGSTFAGWSGSACAGSSAATCTVTLTADASIAASFAPAPLQNVVAPAITGTHVAGNTLTCTSGTWNQPASFSYAWYQEQVANPKTLATKTPKGRQLGKKGPGAKKTVFKRGSVVKLPTFVQVASGQTYVVPALTDLATYYCQATATALDRASVSAPSPLVTATPSPPELTHSAHRPFRTTPPHIGSRVGVSGTNICTPGVWQGDPLYSYHWYLLRRRPSIRAGTPGLGLSTVLGSSQLLTVPERAENQTIECEVTATNKWGTATAVSNTYKVPPTAPKSTGVPQVTVTNQQPAGQFVVGAGGGWSVAEQTKLDCDDGTWNRSDLHFTKRWVADYPALATEPGGTVTFDMRPDHLQYDGLNVHCEVTATTPSGLSSVAQSGPIAISNGCTEWYADVIDPGTIDSRIGGPNRWLYAANPDDLFDEDESGGVQVNGLFGLAGGDLNHTDDKYVSPHRAALQGPNCSDYGKYLDGQGYDIKQEPGPDTGDFWIEGGNAFF
jgi:hypothetical protein